MILMRVVPRQDAQNDRVCTCAKGLVVEGTVPETEDLNLHLVTLPLFGGAFATLVYEKNGRTLLSKEHDVRGTRPCLQTDAGNGYPFSPSSK